MKTAKDVFQAKDLLVFIFCVFVENLFFTGATVSTALHLYYYHNVPCDNNTQTFTLLVFELPKGLHFYQ